MIHAQTSANSQIWAHDHSECGCNSGVEVSSTLPPAGGENGTIARPRDQCVGSAIPLSRRTLVRGDVAVCTPANSRRLARARRASINRGRHDHARPRGVRDGLRVKSGRRHTVFPRGLAVRRDQNEIDAAAVMRIGQIHLGIKRAGRWDPLDGSRDGTSLESAFACAPEQTPYEILRVNADASFADLRRAHRRLLRETHPDMGGSAARCHAINSAWRLIGDPVDRAAYDERHRDQRVGGRLSHERVTGVSRAVRGLTAFPIPAINYPVITLDRTIILIDSRLCYSQRVRTGDYHNVVDDFRRTGLKASAPRVSVMGIFDRLTLATVDEVFLEVRKALPATSMQTICGELAALTDAGLVRRIKPAGLAARFERRVGDHHHLGCTRCGAIDDVDCVVGRAPCLSPSNTRGYSITSAEVYFWGECPRCQLETVRLPRAFSSA